MSGHADAIEPHHEYRKRVESAQNITALKGDLFGDSVNLYNGKTEFTATDIDVPGNSALPVRLQRRFNVELHLAGGSNFNANLNAAGAWDIEVPHISGTFAPVSGWSEQRCSSEMVPSVNGNFRRTEIWQGNTIHVPGSVDRVMLRMEADTPRPSDGTARKWTTGARDAIDCIPMKSGLAGEGFRVVDTEGVRYYFDITTSRNAGTMEKRLSPEMQPVRAGRTRVYLLASKVEDRFGNTVQYQYNNDGLPVRIWGSDGREITLSYNSAGRLASASAGDRTWTYEYYTVEGQARLRRVLLPDGSSWRYTYSNALSPSYVPWDGNSTSNCREQPPAVQAGFTFTIDHPSGAVGKFGFGNSRHYRSGVHMSECLRRVSGSSVYYELNTPNYFDVMSLGSKTIIGPGIPQMTWRYSYGGGIQPLWGTSGSPARYPCSTCPPEKTVVVTNPDQSETRYRYGFQHALNEGRLLGSEVISASGEVLRKESTTYMPTADVASQPFAPRYGIIYSGDDPSTAQVRPVVATDIEQDGVVFRLRNNSFDAFARASRIVRSSPTYTRSEAVEYHDNTVAWVLGQEKKVTNLDTGAVVSQTSFNAKSMPHQTWSFGKLQQTLTYATDGTVATVKDARNNATTLSSWHRGIPRSITYADGSKQTAVVDDNGWITRVTDANGYATDYTYDAMGRLASIVYPTSDSAAWNTTTQRFTQVDSSEYGIPAGHWRQTVATGNGRKIRYFDALWRPLVVREFDTNNGYSNRFTRFTYDHDGRVTFASYPDTVHNPTTGTRTTYDALGRPTRVTQDSELGALTTRTEYLSGFRTRVTNPRGKQTVTSFMAFDQPTTDWPVAIGHPEGVFTDIARDVFGKPTAITRRNSNGSVAVTRNYVYDAHQQLCKTLEPETGATLVDYDAAGNIAWSASGLSLPTLSCDRGSVAAGSRVTRTYDARNRLRTLTFPDGNGSQSWSYTADGLPSQVTTYNDDGLTTAVNAYTYNKRRLLTGESIRQPGLYTWALGYGYDANGHLAVHTYPGDLTVDYAPNALGQPTRAGAFATGVSYFPNGAMKQFTYGNGIVHTLAQNARGLPDRSRDVDGSRVIHDDGIDYDANGNVMAITDGANAGRGNRDMSYDGLDRLTGTDSPMFGDAVYAYDVLDNLTRVKVAGRDHTYRYDGRQRLTNVMDTAGGASVIGLGYDPRGNLANKNGTQFEFDHGNRLREVIGKEYYRYDAHGRRIEAIHPTAGSIFSMYGQDGVLRYQEDHRRGKAIQYVHLNGSLVAEVSDAASVPAAPTLTVPASSSNGSFTVNWSAADGAKTYRLGESRNGGAWTEVTERTTRSWSTSGRSNGSYRYRVRGCAMGCSGYSAIKTVTVALIPQGTPTLTTPAYVTSGNYAVSWTAVSLASRYELQERKNGGSWSEIHDGPGGSSAISGKPSGAYDYRVRACNAEGCADWSAMQSTSVELPPAKAPVLTVPAQGLSGNYTVSWSAVAGATEYTLQERANGGSWVQAYSGPNTSKPFSSKAAGPYDYRVQACNPAGCSGWTSSQRVEVIHAPTGKPTLTVPATNTSGSYTVSWTAVAGATRYQLQERPAGGSYATIHNAAGRSKAVSGKATGSYEYRVRACNADGCGPYSPVTSTAVTRPPAAAPTLTAPAANTTGSYAVNWTAVTDATRYQLQERLAGGSYATIHNASGRSKAVSGKATGTYQYRVRACNDVGCGSYSAAKSTKVTRAPTAKPTVSAPASSTSGNYTVSWTAVSGAAAYQLQERKKGGSWARIHNGSSRSEVVSGKAYATWEYRARGCNDGGCGGYSAVKSVVVAPPPPPVPTGLRAVQTSAWMCQVTWNASSGATRYELKGRLGIAYQGTSNFFVWDAQCESPYQVRACNAHNCSNWSGPAVAPPWTGGPGQPYGEGQSAPVEGGDE